MKTVKVLSIAGAILMLSQLSLAVRFSGAAENEESSAQYDQPFENIQELMIEEEAEPSDEVSLEMEEQIAEFERELMAEEEAGPFDENSPEGMEQDDPREEDNPAE
ncbi:MAG: hypothetical protein OEM01_02375 [Desulfobulbaceae bacterium]|nr:hypothetical protein [Desulfobulbaceae bacterium]